MHCVIRAVLALILERAKHDAQPQRGVHGYGQMLSLLGHPNFLTSRMAIAEVVQRGLLVLSLIHI